MTRDNGAVPIALGIEEAPFLVAPDSRDLVRDPDSDCQRKRRRRAR